jgi:hypothetical protein
MWGEKSQLPITFEALYALIWITVVASLPLLVSKLEGTKLGRAQWAECIVMWVVFFSAILFFTQLLSFQSAHFKENRSLTIVEAVYLLAQILTTVGYGDITPGTTRAQAFVAFYVLFSLCVLANVCSECMEAIGNKTKQIVAELAEKADRARREAAGENVNDNDEAEMTKTKSVKVQEFFAIRPPPLHLRGLIGSVSIYFLCAVVGMIFYSNKREGKTLFEGAYMSVITLSTVGFGAFTPVTESGKIFGAYWMLFGCAALAAVIGHFTDVCSQIKARENWNPVTAKSEQAAFFASMPSETDELTFLKKTLLHKNLVSDKDLQEIEEVFSSLASKGETISRDTFDRFASAEA